MLLQIRKHVDSLQDIQSEINVVLKSSSVDILFAYRGVTAFFQFVYPLPRPLSSGWCLPNLPFYRHSRFAIVWPEKKISFQCKRAISKDVQVLRMRKGRRPEGIWINTRFMSLWDFTLILKGRRDPQSFLVRNNDLPLRSNLKREGGGGWRCIIPANAQCH